MLPAPPIPKLTLRLELQGWSLYLSIHDDALVSGLVGCMLAKFAGPELRLGKST